MKKLKITELRKHAEHYNPILDLFLLPIGRKIRNRCGHGPAVTFEGQGLDGIRQSIIIYECGHIRREWTRYCQYLPALSGKVLSMLMDFGYELSADSQEVALRYSRFTKTGVSNLHHREVLSMVKSMQGEIAQRQPQYER